MEAARNATCNCAVFTAVITAFIHTCTYRSNESFIVHPHNIVNGLMSLRLSRDLELQLQKQISLSMYSYRKLARLRTMNIAQNAKNMKIDDCTRFLFYKAISDFLSYTSRIRPAKGTNKRITALTYIND